MQRRNTIFALQAPEIKPKKSLHGPNKFLPVIPSASVMAATAAVRSNPSNSTTTNNPPSSTLAKRKVVSRARSQTEWAAQPQILKKSAQPAQNSPSVFSCACAFTLYREKDARVIARLTAKKKAVEAAAGQSPLRLVGDSMGQCIIRIKFDRMVIASRKADGVEIPKEKMYKIKVNKKVSAFLTALAKRENLLRADFYELCDYDSMTVVPGSARFTEVINGSPKPRFLLRLSSDLDADDDGSSSSSSPCPPEESKCGNPRKDKKAPPYPLLPGTMPNSTAFLMEEQGLVSVTMPGLHWIPGLAEKRVCGGVVSKALTHNLFSEPTAVLLPARVEGDMSLHPVPAVIFRDTSTSMMFGKRGVVVWCHSLDEDLHTSSPTIQAYSAAARIDIISPEYLGFGVRREEALWHKGRVTCRDLLNDIAVTVRHAIGMWDDVPYILYGRGEGADLALNFALSLYGKSGPTDWQTEAARCLLGLVVVEDPAFCKETVGYVTRLGDTLDVPVLFCSTPEYPAADAAFLSKFALKLKCAYCVRGAPDSKKGWPLEKGVELIHSISDIRKLKSKFYSFAPDVPCDPSQRPCYQPDDDDDGDGGASTLKQDVFAFRRWLKNRGHDQMAVEMFIGSGVRTIGGLASADSVAPAHSGKLKSLYMKALSEEAIIGMELTAQPWGQLKEKFAYRFKTCAPKRRSVRVPVGEVPALWKVESDDVRNDANRLIEERNNEDVPPGMTKIVNKKDGW